MPQENVETFLNSLLPSNSLAYSRVALAFDRAFPDKIISLTDLQSIQTTNFRASELIINALAVNEGKIIADSSEALSAIWLSLPNQQSKLVQVIFKSRDAAESFKVVAQLITAPGSDFRKWFPIFFVELSGHDKAPFAIAVAHAAVQAQEAFGDQGLLRALDWLTTIQSCLEIPDNPTRTLLNQGKAYKAFMDALGGFGKIAHLITLPDLDFYKWFQTFFNVVPGHDKTPFAVEAAKAAGTSAFQGNAAALDWLTIIQASLKTAEQQKDAAKAFMGALGGFESVAHLIVSSTPGVFHEWFPKFFAAVSGPEKIQFAVAIAKITGESAALGNPHALSWLTTIQGSLESALHTPGEISKAEARKDKAATAFINAFIGHGNFNPHADFNFALVLINALKSPFQKGKAAKEFADKITSEVILGNFVKSIINHPAFAFIRQHLKLDVVKEVVSIRATKVVEQLNRDLSIENEHERKQAIEEDQEDLENILAFIAPPVHSEAAKTLSRQSADLFKVIISEGIKVFDNPAAFSHLLNPIFNFIEDNNFDPKAEVFLLDGISPDILHQKSWILPTFVMGIHPDHQAHAIVVLKKGGHNVFSAIAHAGDLEAFAELSRLFVDNTRFTSFLKTFLHDADVRQNFLDPENLPLLANLMLHFPEDQRGKLWNWSVSKEDSSLPPVHLPIDPSSIFHHSRITSPHQLTIRNALLSELKRACHPQHIRLLNIFTAKFRDVFTEGITPDPLAEVRAFTLAKFIIVKLGSSNFGSLPGYISHLATFSTVVMQPLTHSKNAAQHLISGGEPKLSIRDLPDEIKMRIWDYAAPYNIGREGQEVPAGVDGEYEHANDMAEFAKENIVRPFLTAYQSLAPLRLLCVKDPANPFLMAGIISDALHLDEMGMPLYVGLRLDLSLDHASTPLQTLMNEERECPNLLERLGKLFANNPELLSGFTNSPYHLMDFYMHLKSLPPIGEYQSTRYSQFDLMRRSLSSLDMPFESGSEPQILAPFSGAYFPALRRLHVHVRKTMESLLLGRIDDNLKILSKHPSIGLWKDWRDMHRADPKSLIPLSIRLELLSKNLPLPDENLWGLSTELMGRIYPDTPPALLEQNLPPILNPSLFQRLTFSLQIQYWKMKTAWEKSLPYLKHIQRSLKIPTREEGAIYQYDFDDLEEIPEPDLSPHEINSVDVSYALLRATMFVHTTTDLLRSTNCLPALAVYNDKTVAGYLRDNGVMKPLALTTEALFVTSVALINPLAAIITGVVFAAREGSSLGIYLYPESVPSWAVETTSVLSYFVAFGNGIGSVILSCKAAKYFLSGNSSLTSEQDMAQGNSVGIGIYAAGVVKAIKSSSLHTAAASASIALEVSELTKMVLQQMPDDNVALKHMPTIPTEPIKVVAESVYFNVFEPIDGAYQKVLDFIFGPQKEAGVCSMHEDEQF